MTVYNVGGQYAAEYAANDSRYSVSSGMYFYHLEAGGEFLEIKMLLLLK